MTSPPPPPPPSSNSREFSRMIRVTITSKNLFFNYNFCNPIMNLIPFEEWCEQNVSGLKKISESGKYKQVYNLYIPNVPEKCHEYFMNQIFPQFDKLVKFGRKGFSVSALNTATTVDQIYEHATLLLPLFITHVRNILSKCDATLSYSPNETDPRIIKPQEGLQFKSSWKEITKVNDMLRTSIICPSLQLLEEAVFRCKEYCEESNLNYKIVNFYENVARFGEEDYTTGRFIGYVGIHFQILLSLPVEIREKGSDEMTPPVELIAEIQFQPNTIYDGTEESIKMKTHLAYRSIHNGDAELLGMRKEASAAVELYHVYGWSQFLK